MTEVTGIQPINIVSQYTTQSQQGDYAVTTKVNHIDQGGVVRVEHIDYLRYDRQGNLVKPQTNGVDILV